MRRLIEFPLESGGNIVVEVEETELGGTVRAGRSSDIAPAKYTFEEALSRIHAATESALTQLRDLSSRPDGIEMEFGFNLSAEVGAVIAKASTEANYKVTLRWTAGDRESAH